MNRLTPQEIADKLRKCADGPGSCTLCPWDCVNGSCICSIMHAAADAIDNQRTHIQALIKANEAHREMVAGECAAMGRVPAYIRQLRGKVLACWCRLDQRCHADTLLRLANGPPMAFPEQLVSAMASAEIFLKSA